MQRESYYVLYDHLQYYEFILLKEKNYLNLFEGSSKTEERTSNPIFCVFVYQFVFICKKYVTIKSVTSQALRPNFWLLLRHDPLIL